jgi:hypothetical protein
MIIEKYLVLNKYFLDLFGFNNFRDLQIKLKDTKEDIDNDGRSYFLNVLLSLKNIKVDKEDLIRYDKNIQDYVKKISYGRGTISLKYFQYLAVLFTEIMLDRIKNRKLEFINELNEFLNYKDESVRKLICEFTENDLNKLAFYMATGSGKTLIAHINYYQFFHYNLFSPNAILFITPNEGLSKQHFEELQKSGIPARHYSGNLNTSEIKGNNEVLVIEITKFVEEKKGGGRTLSIDTFGCRNLIFVDEGHKGKKKEEQKWAKYRGQLSEKGFVFEYSATFGQILNEENKETLKEYAKSIIFDYSYKYFYLDGYGKDFFVVNVENSKNLKEDKFQEIMFVANLLSFYEQLLIYEEKKGIAKAYNIEKPLWIFVGTTVTGRKKAKEVVEDGKETISDVIQIVKFIKKTIKEEKWLKKLVDDILLGNTKLKNQDDKDIFSNKFEYLKKRKINFDDLYKKVFNGKGDFQICELKNAEGEFGLKVPDKAYFGVINIGSMSEFKKQLKDNGFAVEPDNFSNSLFESIKTENSPINILIGAKKFIEGWDTWRVSSMGLLNIGQKQGPQIIQLFGRGVRLKGKDMSLKRSEESGEIRCLETLNIFSINAFYLKYFLKAIRNEDVEFETIEIPIKLQYEEKWKELTILDKDESKKFEEEVLKLDYDDKIFFKIDLTPRVSTYESKERKEESGVVVGIKTDELKPQTGPTIFPKDKIELLNWNKIYQEIYEWKRLRGYWNLIIDKDIVKNLLTSQSLKLSVSLDILAVKGKKDIEKLEEIALLIIKKYIEKFYEKKGKEFQRNNLKYEIAENKKEQLLLPFRVKEKDYKYIVQIKKDEKELIRNIKKLTTNSENLYKEETGELPSIYIDRHLFLPILIKDKSKEIDKIIPEGLEDSEVKFINGLNTYLKENEEKLKHFEIYLLRNFSKSGVGFQLEWFQFYPDFIMWIKTHNSQNDQTIVFIEPHGLEHTDIDRDEKIQFASSTDPQVITIKKIGDKINENENENEKKKVRLEYFLLSATKYEDLKKGNNEFPSQQELEDKNILFIEDDHNWTEKMFDKILKNFVH